MGEWSPVPQKGYLPIEDHGLIGDGRGCALVGRDGAISFMCVPASTPHRCSAHYSTATVAVLSGWRRTGYG
ncbi:hypothetical protein [Streptomyces sp. PSKA30]|uniref:hypothetical protein n=1 Tax=Streptomyces sp. PSKA30 TaxID=2874597 RepID=UPI001CD06A29|nr:hypothetical protein [Streptomyces sp. PSKA30]MBZ9643123.1 hypothetical protein [Streptomyces sp. PSKA30]